jgi:hypothetical protein
MARRRWHLLLPAVALHFHHRQLQKRQQLLPMLPQHRARLQAAADWVLQLQPPVPSRRLLLQTQA